MTQLIVASFALMIMVAVFWFGGATDRQVGVVWSMWVAVVACEMVGLVLGWKT